MHKTSGRWLLGLALSLVTVTLWGVLPIALSITLQGLDVYTLTWFRFLVSFVVLALYLKWRGNLPNISKLGSNYWKLVAIATIFLSTYYILFAKGLAQTTPANASVLMQLAPLLMGFGGLLIFKERYTLFQWIGISILTIGLVLFFNEQLSNLISAQTTYLFGSGLIVLAAITWSIYALAQKQLLQSLSSVHIMLMIYGGCAVIFTIIADPNTIVTLNFLQGMMLVFSALGTLIAYGTFAEALEHWEASQISAVLTLAPLVTLLSTWFVSKISPNLIKTGHFTLLAILGAILVVCGSTTIALGKR